MDILQYAESGTYWKRIIYDIVSTEGFNPWDIDVGSLADAYLDKVKAIKTINFEVPGTIILVGSVLLKLKSDIVSGKTFAFEENLSGGDKAYEGENFVADLDDIAGEELPPSALEHPLLVRRIPKRTVTLPELIMLLKRVVTQVERKEIVQKARIERRMEVQLNKKNLERIMREVYRDIRRLSKDKKTTFRELVEDWNKEKIVAYFIPVLHLANKEKIDIEQENAYGEIFITPRKTSG